MQHWEHLCECKASKHCLLYRHTLADLNDLVLLTEKHGPEDPSMNSRRQLTCSNEATLSRKVWITNLCFVLSITLHAYYAQLFLHVFL